MSDSLKELRLGSATVVTYVATEADEKTPFVSQDGVIWLFKSKEDAKKCSENLELFKPLLQTVTLGEIAEYQLEGWIKKGISSIHIVSDNMVYQSSPEALSGGRLENVYYGTGIARLFWRMLQDERGNRENEKVQNDWGINFSLLSAGLSAVPLLVPIGYDDESGFDPIDDPQIHMTEAASAAISQRYQQMKEAGNTSPFHFYGEKEFIKAELVAIVGEEQNRDKVVYLGSSVKAAEAVAANDIAMLQARNGQIMHPITVNNPTLQKKLVPIFTNIADLTAIFGSCHIALFMFDELQKYLDEADGFVFDPGRDGLNYIMEKETADQVLWTMENQEVHRIQGEKAKDEES